MALNVYRGKIQSERPVNATRIKDQLYMFTGTYPLYYKGDGKLYLMPEYQASYSEVEFAGHNTFVKDFDEQYYQDPEDLEVEIPSESNNSANEFEVLDYNFTPKFPFTEGIFGEKGLEAKISFSVPSVYINPNNTESYYLTPKVFERASLPDDSAPYEELESGIDFFTKNNIILGTEAPTNNNVFAFDGENNNFFNTDNIQNLTLDLILNNIPVGFRDLLIEIFIQDNQGEVLAKTFVEIPQITINTERISNYPTEEFPNRGIFKLGAPWSCNQSMEHYGRLLIWGSEQMPDTLFISTNEHLNYFPSKYIDTFETDETEAINSITPFMNILVVQSDSYTWGIKGSNPVQFLDIFALEPNPEAYRRITINSSIGNIAPKSVRPVRNKLFFLSQEGLMELVSLFATDDRYNVKPLDRNIRNLIPQDKEAVAIQFDNQYWINFPSTGETFRYYIDKKAWVKDTYNFDLFNGFNKFKNKDGKLHIITHPLIITNPETGVPQYRIFEAKVKEDIVSDLEKPIITKFLTSKMPQEYPFHWKRYKELKLDFGIQNEFIIDEFIPYSGDSDVNPYTVTANFLANHTYAISLNISPTYDEETEQYNYLQLNNLTVDNAVSSNYEQGLIYFTIGNKNEEDVGIRADNLTVDMFNDSLITDETYDKNLAFKVNIISDNKALIPEVDIATDYQPYNLKLISDELGIMANTFEDTFENSQFGKSYKFVHTNKLQGSGYDIALYYEDNSKVKWTLETLGVTYKMRRTRSR